MAENKFVVKTVFHDENGDTLLREDYQPSFTITATELCRSARVAGLFFTWYPVKK